MLWKHDRDVPPPERAIPPDAVADMNKLLVNVVEAGTGGRARLDGLKIGGKTGTSQDYRDAWFIGFTGDYTCAVWFGNDDFTGANNMTGGSLPAMVFNEIMSLAQVGVDPKPIPGIGLPDGRGGAAVADVSTTAPAEGAGGKLPRKTSIVLDELHSLMQQATVATSGTSTPGEQRSQVDDTHLHRRG